MFNLEQSVADWRQQMLAAGIKTPVPLEELEIHLRDDIERQIKSGLDGKKAFEISIQQIGQPRLLKKEFKKNETKYMKRTLLVLIGIFGVLFGTGLIVPTFAILKQCRLNHEYVFDHHTSTVMLLLAGVLMVAFGVRTTLQGFKKRKA